MAFCTVLSASVQGLGVEMIRVEADVSNGLPMFHMVGYLSSEVKEASERVRTAIRNSGMKLPVKKIIVNLAPATVRKKGASFDLPIALAVLAAMGYIPEEAMERVIVTGELSLEGKIRGVPGVLPMVIEAKEQGCKSFILPGENETEGRLVKGIEILPADNLEELCAYLNGAARSEKSKREKKENEKNRQHRAREDFADDLRTESGETCSRNCSGRRAQSVNGLDPPGSGKTMIAKRTQPFYRNCHGKKVWKLRRYTVYWGWWIRNTR